MARTVLFYTFRPRSFRTTLIWYLSELSRHDVSIVVLAHEEIDRATLELIGDKTLFPRVERTVLLADAVNGAQSVLQRFRRLFRAAAQVVRQYRPEVTISSSDWHSLMEMQLLRCSKRSGALNVTLQDTVQTESSDERRWTDLVNVHLRTSTLLPWWLRRCIVTVRKYLGHIFYYWFVPICCGTRPFWGWSSFVLSRGASGSRDSDCHIVFSERARQHYLRAGTPAAKLRMLQHPLVRGVDARLYDRLVRGGVAAMGKRKIALILVSGESIGLRRGDYALIDQDERVRGHISAVELLLETLSDWQLLFKPHPDAVSLQHIAALAAEHPERVRVTDPQDAVDRYVEIADALIVLPLALSTVMFTASAQRPDLPIISVDLHDEYRADYYRNGELGVEFVDGYERLRIVLEQLRAGTYRKASSAKEATSNADSAEDLPEILERLLNERRRRIA